MAGPNQVRRRRQRLAGSVLVPVSGALLIAGAALVGVAVRDDRFLADPPADWRFDPALVSERDASYPAGLTLLTVGALGVVAGAVTLSYGLRR